MGGQEATRTIRASAHPDAKTVPIFAMTANAFTDDIARSKKAGMNEHLTNMRWTLALWDEDQQELCVIKYKA